MLKIGVLALQGAFVEHINALKKLDEEIEVFEIRQKKDIKDDMNGLILPGGESTTMSTLLKRLDLFDILKEKIEKGLCTFGTCAGMILLAKELVNDNARHFQVLDISVKRNAYGRQLGSFKINSEFKGIGNVEMVFIRGPIVCSVGNDVQILSVVNDEIVAVKQNNILATSYHPELTNDISVHKYFINMIKNNI